MSCLGCKLLHRVSEIDDAMIMTLANEPTGLRNEDRFCFIIPRGILIPDAPTTPVFVTINGVQVEVRDRFGNPMVGNDLVHGVVYSGYYGTEGTVHVQVVNIPHRRCRV